MVLIEYIDLEDEVVVMSDGSFVPITDFFDCDGDECGADDAVSCVAGPFDDGWLSIDLHDAEPVAVH